MGKPDASSPCVLSLWTRTSPPFISVDGEGECLKIICVEDGTLGELLDVFLELTLGFAVLSGSVVVISSISHLAWAGTAAYAEASVAAMAKVGGTFRGSVETVHGFPILQTGLTNVTVLTSLMDIKLWFDSTLYGRIKGEGHCCHQKTNLQTLV
jgi:hypothetical protein